MLNRIEKEKTNTANLERNSQFFLFLSKIGLLNKNYMKTLQTKSNEIDDGKKMIFEISNIFGSYTPSDWFDASSLIYSNWMKLN